nr:MAG: major capsid protein [Microvirus sp.]
MFQNLAQQTRSTNQSYLAKTEHPQVQRSVFNRSFSHKTAINDDRIIPIFVDEILPGDTLSMKQASFIRMNPTVTPLMDNIKADIHYFFVPNRLVWENWQKFNGEQENPGDSTSFVVPQLNARDIGAGVREWELYSLADYMGLPTEIPTGGATVNALPFRAYWLTINEWYRDQNIQDSFPFDKNNGPDTINFTAGANNVLLYPAVRNKVHDYFTSCLPWPQKGPSIPIPSSSSVPVTGIGALTQTYAAVPRAVYESDGTNPTYSSYKDINYPAAGSHGVFSVEEGPTGFPNIRADLTQNTAATINALREAFQLQKLYERDARGGTRYTEIIRAHFGVVSPDARLQRPEFIGGGSLTLQMNPLPQTSESGTSPQGNLIGNGTGVDTDVTFSKSFTEHGFVIGVISLRGQLSYSQGINRMWSRETRWDYYWPALAHIGEQAVLNKELYFDPADSAGIYGGDDDVFGYQARYDEYRYKHSMVTNLMRPGATASLAVWNLSEHFTTRPGLSEIFINSTTPLDRALIVPTEPAFLADFYFDIKHARPMPTRSIPGFVDHF